MPPPSRSIPTKPTDIKTSTLRCAPDWATPRQARHHIFLFDGTWNDETGANPDGFSWDAATCMWVSKGDPTKIFAPIITNVAKTRNALGADGETQLMHYYRGIGNDDENDAANAAGEGAFAHETRLIRNQAYADFLKTFRRGDTLSILGFSRGAALARIFARYVFEHGLMDSVMIDSRPASAKNSGQKRDEIWAMFTHQSKTLLPGAEIPVLFLGLWDTVCTSMGEDANDLPLPGNVAHAVHCLALDEDRGLFRPTLLQYDPAAITRVKEVWFTGNHSDIGGGFFQDALGRITLDFMWKSWNTAALAQGLPALVWQDDRVARATDMSAVEWARHRAEGITAIGRTARSCSTLSGAKPRVHSSVERFVTQGGLRFCEQGAGFPPICTITDLVYQPPAYPGVAAVELYERTDWPA